MDNLKKIDDSKFFSKCDKYGCDYGLVRQDFPMRLTS